ncbi:MAG: hypothetical protein ACK2U9_04135 [Anaerolineae bacterium]
MASYRTRETFFRPDEPFGREQSTLPADIHNGLQLLLAREGVACVFLPIRSMQYQAVIDREEVVFVDAAGGYAHQDGEGGRLIRIAWRPAGGSRDSLTEPVPCEIIYYFRALKEIQWRLIGETRAALRLVLERQRGRRSGTDALTTERRIVPFRRR